MRKIQLPFGRTIGYTPENPERTARRASSLRWDAEVIFQTWPNRASMAKAIRLQQQREYKQTDSKACVPLTDGEGY